MLAFDSMNKRATRVVFLDINGVLSPFGIGYPALDAECLGYARRLAERALIVLTSSWPVDAARDYGIPVDDALRDDERRAPERDRLRGIARYLAEHPEVEHWVSIDDDYQLRELRAMARRGEVLPTLMVDESRFIRTDWTFIDAFEDFDCQPEGAGLTRAVYRRALNKLGLVPGSPFPEPRHMRRL